MDIVKVRKHQLEALADGIECCVALWKDGIDSNLPGQRPDEMLMDMVKTVKAWIKNSCGNESQSQSKE